MYRIYSTPDAMPAKSRHIHLLFPFWGGEYKIIEQAEMFSRYEQDGTQIFEWVDNIKDADFAVLPASYTRYVFQEQVERALAFAQAAQAAGVPVIVMTSTDEEWNPPFDCYQFRPSIVKSKQAHDKLFAMPGWSRDLTLETGGQWQPRPKSKRPLVSFMGAAGWSLRDQLYQWRRYWGYLRGHNPPLGIQYPVRRARRLRFRALELLQTHPAIDTAFVVRPRGHATSHLKNLPQKERDARREQVQRDYRDNLMNSDYVVCIRGTGNYSYRLYEALSSGRIPIFVNTDCQLPYEDHIDWREHVIWVEESDLEQIGQIVADYHASLSPDAFVAKQEANRRLWQEWLSPLGFFQQFHRHFED